MLMRQGWQPGRDWARGRRSAGRTGSGGRCQGSREICEADHMVNTGEGYGHLLVCFCDTSQCRVLSGQVLVASSFAPNFWPSTATAKFGNENGSASGPEAGF